jgi:hypothetical protein
MSDMGIFHQLSGTTRDKRSWVARAAAPTSHKPVCGPGEAAEALPDLIPLLPASVLAMDKHPGFRRRVFRALTSEPDYFRRLLALHTGAISPLNFGLRETVSLGWHLLAA